MTDMPPPPPPANVPPPPPPSAGGGFDANAAVNQFKGADPLDLAVVGAGVLALIFSFFSYYSASFSGYGMSKSESVSAWHGFFGWAGVLLLLAAAAVVAAKIVKITIPNGDLAAAGAAVAGLLFTIIALFVIPGRDSAAEAFGVHFGHGFSYWIVLILALVSAGVTGLKVAKAKGLLT